MFGLTFIVMAGLVPAIHVFDAGTDNRGSRDFARA
jgi:hypothetical protein